MSLVASGEGKQLRAGGNDVTLKIHPDDGARDFSLFESRIPPGGRVSPHLHRDYEEAFYVLDGELSFLLGDSWSPGRAGATVHIPRGVVHAFRNETETTALVLVVHTPATAIRMIEELAALSHDADRSLAAAVLARHASEPVN